MNIILTGLRGSGKTKLGKTLSKKLTYNFIDLDEEIEKKEKMKIKKIVELRGWEYFRALEEKVAKNVAENSENTVIATGGGTIMNSDSLKALKAAGKMIYLYRKPQDCIKYIKKDPNRPALTNAETIEEEVKEIYTQRNHTYCKSANYIQHRTEDLNADAEEIINKLFEA